MQIAVIGAGIAGLACARRLVDGGHDVVVFERSKGPGGRAATRRTEIGGFDHGAQYLTARHPSFVAQVDTWSRDGIVEPWPVEAHSLQAIAAEPPVREPSTGRTLRWVGTPGMSAIGKKMAEGLDVRYDASILRVDAVDGARGSSPRWSLQRREDDSGGPAVTEGLFDAVVIAVPAASAVGLLGAESALAHQAGQAQLEPCWALLLGFAEPIAADLAKVGDAAFVNGGRLAWIARESSKPERQRWRTVDRARAVGVERRASRRRSGRHQGEVAEGVPRRDGDDRATGVRGLASVAVRAGADIAVVRVFVGCGAADRGLWGLVSGVSHRGCVDERGSDGRRDRLIPSPFKGELGRGLVWG